MKRLTTGILLALLLLPAARAKMDLVILPTRDSVQLTIYNSADLSLVRESRALTMRQGINRLQFSWANTLIDPTSLSLVPLEQADQIDVFDLTYPPRVQNLGLWNIRSGVAGKVPVEITYFTSGLTWRAFYMGTLSPDEKTMHLQGYVRVQNNSGEDYENAQVRLIVGKVHLLDEIAQLAQRQPPYGRPDGQPPPAPARDEARVEKLQRARMALAEAAPAPALARPKEIRKEGLSEYFLYTIEGRETIPHGWSKRLPSFTAETVPVVNLYKYEEERYGRNVVRFLSFKNDKEHKLGETPIPGGMLKVYRNVDTEAHLSYEGQSSFKYIPVEEDVELNLGAVANVVVEPKMMAEKTDQFLFDNNGNINGWDQIQTWQIEVKNTRPVAIEVEVLRNFPDQYWKIDPSGDYGDYEKQDVDTVKFKLRLKPGQTRTFRYVWTHHLGRRRD